MHRRQRPLKKDNSLSEQIDCDTDLPYQIQAKFNLILITYERQHNFQRSRQPHLQLSSTTAVKTSVYYQNIAIPSCILIGTFKFLASRLNDKSRKKRFVVRYYDQQQSHFTHKNGRKLLITAGLEHGLCHGDALLISYLA